MRTPPSQSPELRLLTITETIEDWIARLGPSVVSIERVFAQDNLRSVIGVAQVMGTGDGHRCAFRSGGGSAHAQ